METFTKFLYDFLGQFLAVFILVIQGFFRGIKATFNIPAYVEIFEKETQGDHAKLAKFAKEA